MDLLPDPAWPVLVLAGVQFVDAAMCVRPPHFIALCLKAVNWPRKLWWLLPPIKSILGTGMIAGLWFPYIAAVSCTALVAYFLVAIGMHIGAGDLGRNLYINAVGMLSISATTLLGCFVLPNL
ncbi:hypothetical protein [Nocardia carnea]|uniref:hypothetical protein n=1 Tax=Nocardia carnea TaxID=37328 RepID=UPI002455B34C|nr:hypothetical protein [Nocardia carnea]